MSGMRPAAGKKPGIDWRLVRFLAVNLLIGATAGCAFVAAALYLDIGGLGTLIAASPDRFLAVFILCFMMTITWGSASMGTAVFLLPRRKEGDESRGARKKPAAARLALALAPAGRRGAPRDPHRSI